MYVQWRVGGFSVSQALVDLIIVYIYDCMCYLARVFCSGCIRKLRIPFFHALLSSSALHVLSLSAMKLPIPSYAMLCQYLG